MGTETNTRIVGNKHLKLSMGGDGTIFIPTTTEVKDKFQVIVINEDATFDLMEDVNGNDLLQIINLSTSDNVSKGMVIKVPYREISKVKLGAGTAIGVR